jgi:hypothetical protein
MVFSKEPESKKGVPRLAKGIAGFAKRNSDFY